MLKVEVGLRRDEKCRWGCCRETGGSDSGAVQVEWLTLYCSFLLQKYAALYYSGCRGKMVRLSTGKHFFWVGFFKCEQAFLSLCNSGSSNQKQYCVS